MLNQVFQEEQMDIVLRYFSDDAGLVGTKCLDVALLKRPNSSNAVAIANIDLGSMDGPNVNWDVLKMHSKYREENELSEVVNICSCSVDVMHGTL